MVFVFVHKCVYFTVQRPEIERTPKYRHIFNIRETLLDARFVVCAFFLSFPVCVCLCRRSIANSFKSKTRSVRQQKNKTRERIKQNNLPIESV